MLFLEDTKISFEPNDNNLMIGSQELCPICGRELCHESKSYQFRHDRIFINDIDSYHGKNILKVLSDSSKKLSIKGQNDKGVEKVEEWEDGNVHRRRERIRKEGWQTEPLDQLKCEDFWSEGDVFNDGWNLNRAIFKECTQVLDAFTTYVSNCVPKDTPQIPSTYQIIGTCDNILKVPPPMELCEYILQPRASSAKNHFQTGILCSSVLIFDITQDEHQIEDAQYALKTILSHITSSLIKEQTRKFILISTTLTWASTERRNDPKEPFTEKDFLCRRPHPSYEKHFSLENDVFNAGKMHPTALKTYIVWSGLTYGFEEGPLDSFFRLGWMTTSLPIFGEGFNKVPMIHVQDLSKIVGTIIECIEDSPMYIFAVEVNTNSLRENIGAICNTMGVLSYICDEDLDDKPEFSDIGDWCYDILRTDLLVFPHYIMTETKFSWRSSKSFKDNISYIVQEYLMERNIVPLKIILYGPADVKKSMVAKRLSEFYGLEYIALKDVQNSYIKNLKKKIKDLINKKQLIDERASLESRLWTRSVSSGSSSIDGWPLLDWYSGESNQTNVREFGTAGQNDFPELNGPLDCGGIFIEKEIIELSNELIKLQVNKMKNGDALPDDEVVRILKLKLDKSTQLKIKGYVLDGFPENLSQAKLFFETPNKLRLENESDCVELWRIEEGPVSEVKEYDEPEQPLDYKPNMAIHLRVSKPNIHDGQLRTSINHPEFEAKLLDCPNDCSRVKKPSSLLDYFLGKDITLIGALVEDELEDVIPKLISKIGPPRIYDELGPHEHFSWRRKRKLSMKNESIFTEHTINQPTPIETSTKSRKTGLILKETGSKIENHDGFYMKNDNSELILENECDSDACNSCIEGDVSKLGFFSEGSSFEEDMGEILMNTPNYIDSPLTKMSDEILKYEPLLINNITMSKLGLIGRRIKSIMNSLTGIFHPSSSTDVIHKDRPTNTEYLPKQKESTGKYSERQQLYKSTVTNEYSDEEASYKRIDFEETRGRDALTKEKKKGITDSEHPDRPGSVLSRCPSTETLWSIDLNTENHVEREDQVIERKSDDSVYDNEEEDDEEIVLYTRDNSTYY